MDTKREAIGERIAEVRKGLGWKQPQFGDYIGVSKQSVSGYERGEVFPTIEALTKIAQVGGVSLDWLLLGKGPRSLRDEYPTQVKEKEDHYDSISQKDRVLLRMLRSCPLEIQETIETSIMEAHLESKVDIGKDDRRNK